MKIERTKSGTYAWKIGDHYGEEATIQEAVAKIAEIQEVEFDERMDNR